MTRIASKILSGFAAAALFTAPTLAEVESYTLDASHTSVLFFVNHLGFSDMQGEFNDVEGTLSIDRDNLAATKVTATMRSVAVDMDDDQLNYHIRSSDFFDVLKFPQLTFETTSFTSTGDTSGTLTGTLSMLGVSKPVTLDVSLTGEGPNPITNNHTVAFKATGTLKRSEWGMEYLVGAIGDDVNILITAELVRN